MTYEEAIQKYPEIKRVYEELEKKFDALYDRALIEWEGEGISPPTHLSTEEAKNGILEACRTPYAVDQTVRDAEHLRIAKKKFSEFQSFSLEELITAAFTSMFSQYRTLQMQHKGENTQEYKQQVDHLHTLTMLLERLHKIVSGHYFTV